MMNTSICAFIEDLCLANIKFVIVYVHYVVLTGNSFHTCETCLQNCTTSTVKM